MKKFFIFLMLVGLFGCRKSETPSANSKTPPKLLMSINKNTNKNTCFNWSSTIGYKLASGVNIGLPWAAAAATQIPSFISDDNLKEEGWKLIYNFLNAVEQNQNYLIFYNIFSGVLRTYYYMEDSVGGTNGGAWGYDITGTTSLLNNINYFAESAEVIKVNPGVLTSNIVKANATKAISKGWNVFEVQLTYDPMAAFKNLKMGIFSHSKSLSQVNLTGNVDLKSEGTIVSGGTSSSAVKGIASGIATGVAKKAGSSGGAWLLGKEGDEKKMTFGKLSLSLLTAAIDGGVSGLVKEGINLLFGSFLGKKGASTTTDKIEFKTNGTIDITGVISTDMLSNNVKPIGNILFPGSVEAINNHLLPCYNKSLGNWNLEKQPIIEWDKYLTSPATLIDEDNPRRGRGPIPHHRRFYLRAVSIILNPELMLNIERYEMKTDLFYYAKFQGSEDWTGDGAYFPRWYRSDAPELVYSDDENVFYKFRSNAGMQEFLRKARPDGQPLEAFGVIDKKIVVKVTVILYPKKVNGFNSEPIYETRTYIPAHIVI